MIKLNDLEQWASENQEYYNSDPLPDSGPQGMRVMQADTSLSFYDDDEDIYDAIEDFGI